MKERARTGRLSKRIRAPLGTQGARTEREGSTTNRMRRQQHKQDVEEAASEMKCRTQSAADDNEASRQHLAANTRETTGVCVHRLCQRYTAKDNASGREMHLHASTLRHQARNLRHAFIWT